MHIGILSARTARYHPNRRLIEAAAQAGHRAVLLHPKNCISNISADSLSVEISGAPQKIDVLLPRIGASINQYALTLVRHFELSGIPVVNDFQSLLLTRNKFLSLQTLARNGIPVPESYYVSNIKNFEQAVSRLGGYPVVAKIINSRQGKGVMVVESAIIAKFIMDNLMDRSQGLLLQQFIHPDRRRDIRALVLGDRVVAAMELKPSRGDFRTNIHLNGKGRTTTLDKEIQELAVRSSRALGLKISGTDIILDAHGAPWVIEANYSPGFRGLEAAAGLDVASNIIQYVVQTCGGNRCISPF